MKKLLIALGVVGMTATLSACHTTTNKNGLSSLSVECRTAGFNCVREATAETPTRVRSSSSRVNRTERVFSRSLRK